MQKLLFLLIFFVATLHAHTINQLVVVLSSDINATAALLQRYERHGKQFIQVGEPIHVNLGRNGLGYVKDFHPLKMEGDGRAPIGLFRIMHAYTSLTDVTINHRFNTSVITPSLICVDDSEHPAYNNITTMKEPVAKSYERLQRDDHQYDLLLSVSYNEQARKRRGSCIFLHIERHHNAPTAGCTSMRKDDLLTLYQWLNQSKNPHILQLPVLECINYQNDFTGIQCNAAQSL